MGRIDEYVKEVTDCLQVMYLRLDALDRQKQQLMTAYHNASQTEKIILEERMLQSQEDYKTLLKDMKELQAKVEGSEE